MFGSAEKHLSRRELVSCMELGKILTAELDPDRLFALIMGKLSDMIPAGIWSLLLVDRDTGDLFFKLSVDLNTETMRDIRISPGQGVAGRAAQMKQPIVIRDVKACQFFDNRVDIISGVETRSVLCVPLIFGNECVGVIEAINPRDTSGKTLALLYYIAEYAAIAVENTRRYQYIQALSDTDNLTGLYNTRYLYRTLATLLERGKARREDFGLIFMDLDNFKKIVDTFGHLNGSQAIQEVASTIRESLEPPSFGVSYGGDEFVAVLPGLSKAESIAKADEIRKAIQRTVYLANRGLHVKLSASFGVASYPEDATNISRLLLIADKAMFNVKGRGKDGVGTEI